MITVTRIGPGCRTCTSGSETYAWVVKEDCFITPVASTGSVIAESTRSTLCLGPLMVIIAGSASTRANRTPEAKLPVTRGRTSTARTNRWSKISRTCVGSLVQHRVLSVDALGAMSDRKYVHLALIQQDRVPHVSHSGAIRGPPAPARALESALQGCARLRSQGFQGNCGARSVP